MDSGNNNRKSSRRLMEIIGVLRRHRAFWKMTPKKLREILEELGPTYIKIGQIMSMRQEILAKKYCAELEKLRTSAEPMEFEEVENIIEKELGNKAEKIFDSIEQKCIGSASIAQVHRAVLKDGRKVVIKVQRPDIYEIMQADISLLLKNIWLIRLVLNTGRLVDIESVLKELWHTTQVEMDFLQESENLKRFAANNRDIAYVSSPIAIEEYTTSKVLVMTDVQGIQIDNIDELKKLGYDMEEIARKTAENYCKQILDDRFFHADPHPGNIRINDGKIEWLDLGMVGEISVQLQGILKRAVKAILRDDVDSVTDAFLMLGQAEGPVDRREMSKELGSIVNKYKSMEFSSFNFASLIGECLNLIRSHRIRIPASISMLCRSMVTMEGTIGIIAPQVNVAEILAAHMANQSDNWDERVNELKNEFSCYIKKAADIPQKLSKTLELLNSGELNINITEKQSEKTAGMNRYGNTNTVLALLVLAFYISASILSVNKELYQVLGIPWLAFCGFILGSVFLIVLLVRLIIRKRK